MDVHIAIRSYGRAKTMRTHKLVENWTVWVPEWEYDDYAAIYGESNVNGVPEKWDGHPARKKNFILDHAPSENVVILDDDISSLAFWEGGARQYFTPSLFGEFLQHGFSMAYQLGVRLWGVNQGKDAMMYRTQHPFSLMSPVLDPVLGHIKECRQFLGPELRYDERFLLKSDYDFWLQNIQKYRKTLRFNKYHYTHDHGTLAGGIVSFRTLELEQKMVYELQRKWGSHIIQPRSSKGGKTATGDNILNIKIVNPIKGM